MKKLVFLIVFVLSTISGFSQFRFNSITQNLPEIFTPYESSPDDIYWDNSFGPPSQESPNVNCVTTVGNNIYSLDDGRIFYYNDTTGFWNYIGIFNAGTAFAIKACNGKIYIGGNFDGMAGCKAKYIAVWDGIRWDSLGVGLNGKVLSIDADANGNIYAGGEFQFSGDSSVSNIACWDGKNWKPLGLGLDGVVRAIKIKDGMLYAGGDFLAAGDLQAYKIVIWDIATGKWSALGKGISDETGSKVFSVDVLPDGKVVAGGMFSMAGGNDALNIAEWTGTEWQPLADGFDGIVYSLCTVNSKIYAGGNFANSGNNKLNNIAAWDGTKWSSLLNGVEGSEYPTVDAITETSDGGLLIGGTFTKAGNYFCNGLIKWDGKNWFDLFKSGRMGVRSSISEFVIGGNDNSLFAGGGFVKTGFVKSNGISKFNGSIWLGCNNGLTPMSDVVYSMQAVGTDVYFTGWFNKADDVKLNNVAKWKDKEKTWEPIGSGIDGGDSYLGPICVDEQDIYVGGVFKTSQGTTFNCLAHYSDTSWKAVGTNFVGVESSGRATVEALTMDSDKKLYIGGKFEKAGGINANNIAIYDTKSGTWSSIGKGIDGIVYKIVIMGDSVIICGSFSSANGDSNLKNITIWNKKSDSWSGFGQVTNGSVYTIIKWFDDFYIGGAFTKAGDADCSGIAKFSHINGKFEQLGSGLRWGLNPGAASSLIVYRNSLYIGGMFLSAGGKVSTNFARWKNIPLDVPEKEKSLSNEILSISPNPASNVINVSISLPKNDNAELTVFSSLGIKVGTITNTRFLAGKTTFTYNLENLEPGLYFMRLSMNGGSVIKKIIVVR